MEQAIVVIKTRIKFGLDFVYPTKIGVIRGDSKEALQSSARKLEIQLEILGHEIIQVNIYPKPFEQLFDFEDCAFLYDRPEMNKIIKNKKDK